MADSAVKIPFTEAAAPSTPAAGKVVVYAKSDGLMYSKDDAGTETLMSAGGGGIPATIIDAAGDLIQGSAADTAARLAAGAAGTRLQANGAAAALTWTYPPGYEFNHVQVTAGNVSITATTEGTANTIVTGGAVTYDGSTVIIVEFFAPFAATPAGNINMIFVLYDDTGGGAASVGRIGQMTGPDATNIMRVPVRLARRLTPSAASHTYSIRAYVDSGTGTINNGAGGSGNYSPLFIRQYKVA